MEFTYKKMFAVTKDETEFRPLTDRFVTVDHFRGNEILCIEPEGLSLISEQAFFDVAHLLRPRHLESLSRILRDPESSDNDRYVALEMLKNAVIAAEGIFPMCQDTGTAIITAKKGHQVWTGCDDARYLSLGVFNAYTKNNLRYSQNEPVTMYEEKNTGCNLPAQIEIHAEEGIQYEFLFIAKGGGSANKTYLFQETKAVLSPSVLIPFLVEKMRSLGTAACPPYHLAVVVGGTSAEMNLKTVKLASAGYLDGLPQTGESCYAIRDLETEDALLKESRKLGIGAQFGGKYFCHDIRVIRLPRHGASCPIGLGVSCSADRNILGKITSEGIFIERLEKDPSKYIPAGYSLEDEAVLIDLDRPMDEIRRRLSTYPVGTRLRLSGRLVVARDIAHAKIKERLDRGEEMPQYFKDHIIYYAGPSKTPEGYPSGSFGPTTAGRMDPYVPIFQAQKGSMVMLAKGNRSELVTESCKRYGGFYLGSIGGPAARIGKECITDVKLIEYPELGMEAIYMITVKDFPAFILVDDKGNDFFSRFMQARQG